MQVGNKRKFSSCMLLLLLIHTQLMYVVLGKRLGSWQIVVSNAGVSAMHLALMHTNKVLIFDRTDYGPSQIRLPNGRCRNDTNDFALKLDCWAHSVELDIGNYTVRPLEILTDTWCSSGAFSADGTLVQTGGFNDGGRVIRRFNPCSDQSCDWLEDVNSTLATSRWYASDQLLPDNRVIVVGGRKAFSYEYVPKIGEDNSAVELPLLTQTYVPNVENNLYPFLHLSSDGNLFIFANQDSILLDYKSNRIVRTFPRMPGGSRSYPSSGSSVMLPLSSADDFQKVEVMICGGADEGAFKQANEGVFMDAETSCGRLTITDPEPNWEMEDMPTPRVMGDMILLPTGEILIINGAEQGTAGWGMARNPSLTPCLYTPTTPIGQRFELLNATTIPRLYHSTAALLPDGKILVAGSNPNVGYSFGSDVMYQTELRIEAYSPYYLDLSYESLRPTNLSISTSTISYGAKDNLKVRFSTKVAVGVDLQVIIYSPPFTTHSYSMNQRLLRLELLELRELMQLQYLASVAAPLHANAAPPGYYLLFVVNMNVPSEGVWVQLNNGF